MSNFRKEDIQARYRIINMMTISYKKLWLVMKNNKMNKKELATAAEISNYSMAKLNQNRSVTLEIMLRLCNVFHCDIGDLVEMIEE